MTTTYTITELRSYGTVLVEATRGPGQVSHYEIPVELLPPRTRLQAGATVTPWVAAVVAHRVIYMQGGRETGLSSLHIGHADAMNYATRNHGLRGIVTDLAELPQP